MTPDELRKFREVALLLQHMATKIRLCHDAVEVWWDHAVDEPARDDLDEPKAELAGITRLTLARLPRRLA